MSKSGFKPWRVFALNDDDEMVISGIAGRFPECHNVDELSYNLYNKVGPIDSDKTNIFCESLWAF